MGLNKLLENCDIYIQNQNSNDYSASIMCNSDLIFGNEVDSSIIESDMKGHKYCLDGELNSCALYGDYYDNLNMCNDILINVMVGAKRYNGNW